MLSEAAVEEEFAEMREREERQREVGFVRARRVLRRIRDVPEIHLDDMGDQDGVVCGGAEVAANDAVRGGDAKVVGEESAPWDVRVDRFEGKVDRFLLTRVEREWVLLVGKGEEERE